MYIKEGEEEVGPRGGAKGGVLLGLPIQVGFAPTPFPIPTRRRGKEEVERRKERGAAAPFPCPFRTRARGAARHLLAALSLLH